MLRRISTVLLLLTATASADDAPPPPPETPTEQPTEPPAAEPAPPEQPPAPAPKGKLTLRALDKVSGEGLPAATIIIKGATESQSLATELDGTFTVELAPGAYEITILTPDYIDERRRIEIAADQTVAAGDIALGMIQAKAKEETIEVYDTIDTRKASAVLAERRAAATVSDAVSSEQIARSPDSNASDAAKRMVAATIQDGRYIVMRGLGGRYSLTLLNGVPLPSPDPDVPAAPLDLFPSSLISNLTVTKTFSPDMPGNFAGGVLGIETRTYPTKFTFKAKVGIANNTRSSWRTLNDQEGGSLDVLGYDDGSRALPSEISSTKLAGDPSLSPEQRNAQVAAFKNTWALKSGVAGPNINLGATLGNTHKIEDQRISYVTNVNFSHGYAHRVAHVARPGGEDGMGGTLPSVLQLDDSQGIEQAALSGIGSFGWVPKSGHKLDFFSLYSHTADITSSFVTGTENNSSVVERTRLQFLERELFFNQLTGEHELAPKAILEWQGNISRVAQHEPDTKDLLRTQTVDGNYAISSSAGSSERLFGELGDWTVGGGAAVRVPLEQVKLKLGTALQRSTREFQQRRFHFNVNGDAAYQSPHDAFDPENAGLGMTMIEMTVPTDGYAATRLVGAAYAMADTNITDKLRVVGGARFEHSELDVGLESKLDLGIPPMPRTSHGDNDILPSLNAVYAVTPNSNLRFAYGMTVARPNFREIAPALYYDYVRRRAIGGNPDLAETKIHNADARWETFLGENEVLAASVFGKRFSDPIERTIEEAGDGQNIGFMNAPDATTYGVELEARVSLARLAEQLDEFSVGANLSLIGSRITIGDTHRALQGQSPWVTNVGLGYESKKIGTRVDLLFNSFGRRIEEVGTGGAGNVYEEPFHRLDLAASQPLPHNMRLKLAGSNLLDRSVRRTQDGVDIYSYKTGVTVVGSLELSLE
jgi:outer membrane receptor protein involved in Fe transport